MPRVILKSGKERSVLRRHPWIFSGAIATAPSYRDGDILPVYSQNGLLLAHAYFHTSNSIAGRILSFGVQDPLQTLYNNLKKALAWRQNKYSNARRLVNAEGDGIPGLIVDQYADVIVIQVNTWGIERLKSRIVDWLQDLVCPACIVEKSLSAARLQEGLPALQSILKGKIPQEIWIEENGIPFSIDILQGQKTGFFLDQKSMRHLVFSLSKNKKVLNCFAYTGGFSLAALKGGAAHVDSVDISPDACARNTKHNPDPARHQIHCADAFEFLRKKILDYDLIILDPPAFAKKRGDVEAACKGYKELNRIVLEKAPEDALVLTSSCSSYITETLFRDILAQAGAEAGRFVQIIDKHHMAYDHPISLYHLEGDYLKSFLLRLN